MSKAQRLFTVTSLLLKVATVICMGVLAILVLCLCALLLAWLGLFQIPIPATYLHDVSLGVVLAAAAIAIAAVAICVALCAIILVLISRIVASATAGDPFVTQNAMRLNAIGALLLVLQAIGLSANLAIAAMPQQINQHLHVGFDPSLSGLFAALLVFVLAQIFQRGSEMRADLEGTV